MEISLKYFVEKRFIMNLINQLIKTDGATLFWLVFAALEILCHSLE